MNVFVRHWVLPLVITIVCIVIAFYGDAGRMAMRYVGAGQGINFGDVSHRWITGHFTHIGWRHLVLNLVGLLSIWAIYGRVFKMRAWLVFLIVCTIGISLGFSLLSANMSYYVGLSGVLHGILAAAVTILLLLPAQRQNLLFRSQHRWEEIVVLAGLLMKIGYEQVIGAVPMTAGITGGAVMVDAHLYGACIGTGFAVIMYGLKRVNRKNFQQINTPPTD